MRMRTAFPAAVLTALGLVFLPLDAAHAHGSPLEVVVTGHREGHVTADITWENDGDVVDEAVAGTVNAANADGSRTLGPWRLVRDPGSARSGWTTAEALPPGSWTVSVDVGFPALGHGSLDIAVPVVDPAPATSTPAPRTGTHSSPSPQSPAPEPSATAAQRPAVWWTVAGTVAAAAALAVLAVLVRRGRARRAGEGA